MNVSAINRMIRQMLFSQKPVLVANTIPLFEVAQLATGSGNSVKDNNEVIEKIWRLIEKGIQDSRDAKTRSAQPLLYYYKMRNIISVFTTMLNYLQCKTKIGLRQEKKENLFIVKKLRRCNFCGYHLDQPHSFTFSTKCKACSLHNAAIVLPACFMCDNCVDKNSNY